MVGREEYRSRLTSRLLAQLEFFGHGLVPGQIRGVEIIQQPPPLADHDEQTPAGAMILLEFLKVLSQVVNALGEQRHLDIRGTRVPLMQLKIANRLRLRIHT